jgi:uncharacterized protein YbjT (DUF2867 family)
MARTLIVGATGHLGQEVAKAAHRQGHEVHVLVRPATRKDPARMKALEGLGATIHEGDLADRASVVRAFRAVDNVVSAVGGMQIGDEGALVEAARETGIKRFIPSDFGLDPKAAGPGSCFLFDAKAAVHQSIKAAGVPYTFMHTGGFFSYWVFSLGDLTKLGGRLPPDEVGVYGEGNVKGSLMSVADVASLTVRALNDPAMENKEVRVIANALTQDELIEVWQRRSGRKPRRTLVSAVEVERVIATSTGPEQAMTRVLMELHRSMWMRGDAVKRLPTSVEATEAYPDLKLQSVEQGFSALL